MSLQASPASGVAPDALSRRRRIGILAICCTSLFLVSMDTTIVNIALPSIRHDLHASVSGLQWTVDAYTMVIASLLMLSGSTADRLGRRRTFQTGLLLFTAGSLLCSLAPNLGFLIAFRMLQAIGGSMLNPVAMSIITNTFTDPRERAQAIGAWAGVMGVSMALGPIIGGALVQSVGWRSIFWINIPVGLASCVLVARYVPESKAPHARRVDPVGQGLVIVLLASLTYGIIEGPATGWTSARILAAFLVAAAALAGVLGYEPRRTEPLVDLRFFRSAPFSGATLVAVCAFAGLGGFLFLNTLYLQEARGLSPLRAGLDTLPMALCMIVLAPLSGRVVARFGARVPLVAGGLGIGVSSLMLTHLTASTSFTWLFVAYFAFGAGLGIVNPPITNTAVSGMPRTQAGVASGIASTSRQVGATLGVAVVGAIATASVRGTFATGLASATHTGWSILAGCGAAIVVLGVVSTSAWGRETARRAAAYLAPEDAAAARASVAGSGRAGASPAASAAADAAAEAVG